MRMAIAAFASRIYERSKGSEDNWQRNPLPATLATTGGGRSFFMDELAALRPEDLEMYGDLEEMTKILLTVRWGSDVVQVLPKIMQEMMKILQNTVSLQTQNVKFCLTIIR